jgi:DNA modification methylase
MTPHYADPWLTVWLGDCREVMAQMEPESVHCVVTSPPFWGLRDYGVTGQLGLEPTPEEYVANMVAVFREVRRVLRSDGTVWLNLGDSYSGSPNQRNGEGEPRRDMSGGLGGGRFMGTYGNHKIASQRRTTGQHGLKPKDLVGIPWRVAFALQANGWYLRSDIIWAKPNPMPESVTDRPTRSHEYVFLLSKSARYFFDADAVREPHVREWSANNGGTFGPVTPAGGKQRVLGGTKDHKGDYPLPNPAGRNLRSVWTIATAPYPGAHFATFPPKLVEPCIKAGTSEKGVCPECGAPWVREVERQSNNDHGINKTPEHLRMGPARGPSDLISRAISGVQVETTGWRPSCAHTVLVEFDSLDGAVEGQDTPDPVPATVLDPFAGSGTTGMVAQSLSRRAVLIDLSADYLKQLMDRNRDMPLGLGA